VSTVEGRWRRVFIKVRCSCIRNSINAVCTMIQISLTVFVKHPVKFSLKYPSSAWVSGFSLETDEKCALQGYYAASSGNFLPTFRDNLSLPYLGAENPKWSLLSQHSLRNNPEERSSYPSSLKGKVIPLQARCGPEGG